jgi:DNA polymerase-3 subunit epsilon
MRLKLKRPVVFFDLETTGTSIQNDRIVEYSFIKINPDGSRSSISSIVNPEINISPEVAEIHGITNDDVKGAPTLADKATEIMFFISDCDFGGFNIIGFDVPMLAKELTRVGYEVNFDDRKLIDAQKIFFKKEPRTLSAALKFYCGREHTDAHGADADTEATIDVLMAQLEKYDDIPETAEGIHKYCRECNPNFVEPSGRIRWNNGEAVIGFKSNFQNSPLKDIVNTPKGKQFLKWIINNNFSLEVKQICKEALKGKFPKKGES